jgi:DNA helicase INO80
LLEESDSESDGDQTISEQDLRILLKIHRCRRKYQKKYHTDIMNSQYTYYGGGLLSEVDRFPEHQKQVVGHYGYSVDGQVDGNHNVYK